VRRWLPIAVIAFGGVLLLPIIFLHIGAMSPGTTNLVVVAPWIALAFYALTALGLVLLLGGLTVVVLRRRGRLP
jgi:hypothetical protein